MPSSGVQTCALRSEEHTSELQSHDNLVCRLLLAKKKFPPRGAKCANCTAAPPGYTPCALQRCRTVLLRPRRPAALPHLRCPRFFFFFNDTATTEIYTLSLHDALPISSCNATGRRGRMRWRARPF